MAEPGVGGAGRGVFRGRFEFVAGDLFRDKGRYTTFQHEVRIANGRLADQLQEKVAQALRQGLKRKRVSTGTLERVTRAAGNRYATEEGFGVGVIRFLNDDDGLAPYWHQIDVGTDVHVGKRMRGVWVNRINWTGPRYVEGQPFSQREPAGRYYSFGEGGKQAFIPLGLSGGRRALRAQKGRLPNSQVHVRGLIRNPIRPEEYYLRGWETFDFRRSVVREYDRIFRDIGYKVVWQNGVLSRVPLRGSAAGSRRSARGDRLHG